MNCAGICVSLTGFETNCDLDIKIYNLAEISLEKARDLYFHTVLSWARKHEVPRHVDVSEPEEGWIKTIIRFKNQDALVIHFSQEEVPEEEEPDIRECLDCIPEDWDIPHYAIELGYWASNLVLGEYTEDNYYDYLEKWLLGEIE